MNEAILNEILTTLKEFKAEEEKRWEENNRRWEQNEKRWEENNRRWKQNEKRWEENDRRWEQNEKRWEENDRRWKQNDIDKFNYKKEFQRFVEIVDKNFESISKKIDDFIEYSNSIHKKLELRLKKIEANQRYFEKVQETHQEVIDIQNIRLDKLLLKKV